MAPKLKRTNTSEDSDECALEQLVQRQSTLLARLERVDASLQEIPVADRSIAVLNGRLQYLERDWDKFLTIHDELELLASSTDKTILEYFTQGYVKRAERAFFEALDLIQTLKAGAAPATNDDNPRSSRSFSAKLPKISLPTFSGNYLDWHNFSNLFRALIHDLPHLPKSEKLQYLKASLTGEAATLVKNVIISNANYDSAWETLVSQYENTRVLVFAYLQALYEIPTVSIDNLKELKRLRDTSYEVIDALVNFQRPVQHWDDLLIFLIVKKLDRKTRKEWEISLGSTSDCPTLKQFKEFLNARVRTLEALSVAMPTISKRDTGPRKLRAENSHSVQVTNSKAKCSCCQRDHRIYDCDKFRTMPVEKRDDFVRRQGMCINCLSSSHKVATSSSKRTCSVCARRHHTYLHRVNNTPINSPAVHRTEAMDPLTSDLRNRAESVGRDSPIPSCPTQQLSTGNAVMHASVLLATALVRITAQNGNSTIARALVDQGSECSFVSESVAQLLRLPRNKEHVTINGVGGGSTTEVKSSVSFYLSHYNQEGSVISARAFVLQKISSYVPKQFALHHEYVHLRDLAFADPTPTDSGKVDLLIGADLYGEILLEGLRTGPPHSPIAQRTIFGWILSGPIDSRNVLSTSMSCMHHAISVNSIEETLIRFWELEEVPQEKLLSVAEQQCEAHFAQTHSRKSDGRYVVRLPFKSDPSELGDSKQIAISSFHRLEKRLMRDENIANAYSSFLEEYRDLGHMKLVQPADGSLESPVFLPHHPVLRDSSATTKLRVVFNASCLTSKGNSLNDMLHIGQKLQNDLPAVLLRWREHKFVLVADVEKMFRQIWVDDRDQQYQCILWRHSADAPLSTYKLTTVTYGTAAAPFLAQRVLKQVALDEGDNFPLASSVVAQNTYVDDVLFGAQDYVLASQMKSQVIELLKRAGFNLRKWQSHCPSLLDGEETNPSSLIFQDDSSNSTNTKILGLFWCPVKDEFRFSVTSVEIPVPTKRNLLSMIGKLFDPLGWIAPVIVKAKIFLQALWCLKLGWDDALPTDLVDTWHQFVSLLPALNECLVPRWTRLVSDDVHCELHGFSDASKNAYAAVLYLRVTKLIGEIQTSLIMAKTKVSPLKTISIPRLELCAASLLTRCVKYVIDNLLVKPTDVICWTDSTITLAWLQKPPTTWGVFVANRVSSIQTELPLATWLYVPSKSNPADCASRGLSPNELSKFSLWWNGPSWLLGSRESWPKQPSIILDLPEERRRNAHGASLPAQSSSWDLMHRYSSWPKLLRITAYTRRICPSVRKSGLLPKTFAVSVSEVDDAEQFWVREAQRIDFAEEFLALKINSRLSSRSKLKSLNCFVDEFDLIRVGGRLKNSELGDTAKFPFVLPRGRIASMIVKYYHEKVLHGGTQMTLRALRERYWVIGARNLVKTQIHGCVVCLRDRARLNLQKMGDLPDFRVTPSRPFSHTGLDYAGPLNVRFRSGRGHKSFKTYIVIFVCLCVRAIHIELVLDYTATAFLAAFDRFTARRGIPSDLYSDNGSNFQGAERELREVFGVISQDANLLSRLASDRTQWHFIPPSAPHFGGLWEAGVKCVKTHLRRVLGNATPTVEEMTTLLCNIEGCLNSRPMAPLRDDPEDFDTLTPGHFLVGTSINAVPKMSVYDVEDGRLSRWQFIQKLFEKFWRIWSSDYLQSLQN